MTEIFSNKCRLSTQPSQVKNSWLALICHQRQVLKLILVSLLSFFLAACSGMASKTTDHDELVSTATNNVPMVVDEISLQEYQQAIALIDGGQLAEADSLLIKVVDKYPDLAAPLYNLGVISETKKDLDSAVGFYNRAIKADKNYYLAYNNLGVIARSKGNFDDALNYYQRGLDIAPESPELHYNMAVLNEIYLQDYAKAIEHYERYLASFDGNSSEQPDSNVVSWIKDLKRRSR